MGADAVNTPRRRRWRGWWWKLPLLFVGFSVLQVLVLRFEADSDAELQRIKDVFRTQLRRVDPELQLPF